MFPQITEYIDSFRNAADCLDSLKGAEVIMGGPLDGPFLISGGFACIFKVKLGAQHFALKCFTREVEDRALRYEKIADYIRENPSPYFVTFEYLPTEVWVNSSLAGDAEYPCVKMEWIAGETLGLAASRMAEAQDRQALATLAEKVAALGLWLLDSPFAHGDLKHDNLLLDSAGQLRLIDYDGMFVPALAGLPMREQGGPAYQHPRRPEAAFGPALDDFGLCVIVLSLRALSLDPSLRDSLAPDRLLFRSEDYQAPAESPLFQRLYALAEQDESLRSLLFCLSNSLESSSISVLGLKNALKEVLEAVKTDKNYYKLKDEIRELKKNLASMKMKIQQRDAKIDSLKSENNGLKKEVNNSEKALSTVEALEAEKQKLTRELSDQKEKFKELESEKNAIRSTNLVLQEEADAFQKMKAKKTSRIIKNMFLGALMTILMLFLFSNLTYKDFKEFNLWSKTKKEGTTYAYKQFLEEYPSGNFSQQARHNLDSLVEVSAFQEAEAWTEAQAENSISAYQVFIKNYPNSSYSSEANKNLKALGGEEVQQADESHDNNTQQKMEGLPAKEKGNNYYYGENGVEKNYTEVVKRYRKAAEQGNSGTQNNLGIMYKNGDGVEKNYTEAVKWYRKAAEQGNSGAQNNLGVMYENGEGVEKNYSEAVKWYRKAAEQGNSGAQNNLGVMYENGDGVEKNYTEAVKWYRKAAEQRHSNGQVKLGIMYFKEKNYIEAVKWFKKAANQGHRDAQKKLTELGENYDNNTQQKVEELSPEEAYNKGKNYYYGENGVKKNYSQAAYWYRKAAEQRHSDGQVKLGIMYFEEKNYIEAVKWFKKAANQGHSDGQFNLGLMYSYGEGVEKNHTEAVRWLEKAAKQGEKRAQKKLTELGEGW